MNSPPSSLATLLYTSAPGGAQPTTTDEDGVALMTYLREAGQLPYEAGAEGEHEREDLNGEFRLGKRTHGGEPVALAHHEVPTPGSPIDASVPIPDSLTSLPPLPGALFLAPLDGLPAVMPDPVALSDRGEMGGKRRKALHERAGWKEMEDDAHRDKAPREDEAAGTFEYNEVTGAIVGGTPAIPAAAPLDAAPVGEAVGGIEMAVAAAAAATAAVDEAALEEDDDDDGKPTRGRGGKAAGKKSRAEQNRKAQQVYRRNREEKMKRLEADQAALAQTRIRLAAAEARIEQLALDLEAKSIETNALRTSLLTVADNANVSIVTPQNNLVIAPTDWETRDKASVDETGPTRSALALDALARASREVAKANRARRVHPE